MTERSRAARIAASLVFIAAFALGGAAHAARALASDSDAVIIDTDDNLVLAGGTVSPGKPVPENFVGFGGRVVIDQPIGANAVAAGGTVDVRAPVGGKGRFAGGTVSIDAPIGADLKAAGGQVRISKASVVGGGARLMAGDITVDGAIKGDLRAEGETVTINGEVQGDVRALADTVVLGPTAKITGSLTFVSVLKRSEGATVGGEVKHVDDKSAASEAREAVASGAMTGARIFGTVVSYLALLACGAIFLAAAPIFSVEAPDRVKASPGRSIGVGLLTLVGVPILAVLFMITVIGIPVGIMLIALYPFALLLGFLVGALFIANLVPQVFRQPPPPTVAKAIGYFAIALAVVMLLAKVPSIGGLFLTAVLVLGVGAFEVELFRRMRSSSRTRGVEVVRP
jgi:hypothetical protein